MDIFLQCKVELINDVFKPLKTASTRTKVIPAITGRAQCYKKIYCPCHLGWVASAGAMYPTVTLMYSSNLLSISDPLADMHMIVNEAINASLSLAEIIKIKAEVKEKKKTRENKKLDAI